MFAEVIDIIRNYGWRGALVMIVVTVTVKTLGELSKLAVKQIRIRRVEKNQIQLNLHSFFTSVNYTLNVEIASMSPFKDMPVRNALSRDLMYCTISTMKEAGERIAAMDQRGWTHEYWTYEMRNQMNVIHVSFIDKCRDRRIPLVVVSRYQEWYFLRLSFMMNIIDSISASEGSYTATGKTSSLLLSMKLLITTMMGDCERVMLGLNGELTGMEYAGGILEPLPTH